MARVLEGVPELPGWCRGKECSLIGSLEAVLRYHGETCSYTDLMGLSAAAFRVRFAYSTSEAIMGGRAHPGISTDPLVGPHLGLLSQVTGYEMQHDGHFLHDFDTLAVAETIEREIDAGRPVLAMNMRNASDWGVIVGYDPELPREKEDGGYPAERLLCRTYYDPGASPPQGAPSFPWDTYYVRKVGEPLPRKGAIRISVTEAATLLKTESARVGFGGWLWHWEPEYRNGLAAYGAWIRDLGDEEAITSLPASQFLNYWQGHAWMYNSLHDARRSAAVYLRGLADELPGGAGALALSASGVYDQMVEALTHGFDCFPFCAQGYVEPQTGWWIRVRQAQFLGRPIPSYATEWTPEMRRGALRVLKAAKAKDEEALSLLEQLSQALEET